MKNLLIFTLLCFCFITQAQTNIKVELKHLNDSARVYLNNNPAKSNSYLLKVLDLAKTYKNDTILAKTFVNLSYSEKRQGNYHKSLDYLFKSLRINERLNDSLWIGINYFDIAGVNRYLKEYETAINYYNKALLINKKRKDSLNTAITLEQTGIIYRRIKRYDLAESNYKKALIIFQKLKKKRGINRTKSNLARLYIDLGKYKESMAIYLSSLKYIKDSKNEKALEVYYGNIALNYEKLNKYRKSVTYLDSAIYITLKNGYKDRTSTNLLFRSKNYSQLKLHKKALEDYQLHRIYYDSVFNIRNTKNIAQLELNYEFNKKQLVDSLNFVNKQKQLIIKVSAQKKQTQLYIYLFVISLIAFISMLLLYQYKRKLNNESKLKNQLKLEFLNSKLENISNYADQLQVDNNMRFQFKEELLSKIKAIKNKASASNLETYQSLIVDLQTQINTEKRLDSITEISNTTNLKLENKLSEYYPTLTKSEREVCNLISLNLSNKEIMNIRNSSLDSIKSVRYRIRRKLQIPKGEELELFIQKLFLED